jgi:diaminopimelate epimerase
MQGIGNDFVLIDTLRHTVALSGLPALARSVCDRKFGVGADGLIFVLRKEDQLEMAMLNPDGSLSEMCGNGLRCFARLAVDRGYASGTFSVLTGAGELTVSWSADALSEIRAEGEATTGVAGISPAQPTEGEAAHYTASPQLKIDMGEATSPLGKELIDLNDGFKAIHVSMGNPHIVIISDNVDAIPLEEVGPQLEHHPLFPQRTNVHFVQVLSRNEIKQRTWERGAGITLACGTGACACAVATATLGLTERELLNHLPGGDLTLEYKNNGHVLMTGTAEYVFEGEFA